MRCEKRSNKHTLLFVWMWKWELTPLDANNTKNYNIVSMLLSQERNFLIHPDSILQQLIVWQLFSYFLAKQEEMMAADLEVNLCWTPKNTLKKIWKRV